MDVHLTQLLKYTFLSPSIKVWILSGRRSGCLSPRWRIFSSTSRVNGARFLNKISRFSDCVVSLVNSYWHFLLLFPHDEKKPREIQYLKEKVQALVNAMHPWRKGKVIKVNGRVFDDLRVGLFWWSRYIPSHFSLDNFAGNIEFSRGDLFYCFENTYSFKKLTVVKS